MNKADLDETPYGIGKDLPIASTVSPDDLPVAETSSGNFRMENGVEHDPMLSDPATMRLVNIILCSGSLSDF